jgi:transcriptional regulator with XRE-family HTH domain
LIAVATLREVESFGAELRRRRQDAGLSLAALARLVHYSKSHLSKVETGRKPPSPDLAQRCDAALEADGALIGGAASATPPALAPAEAATSVWTMRLAADGSGYFDGGTVLRWGLTPGSRPPPDAEPAIEVFRSMFDHVRGLGQSLAPAALLPILVAQTHALRLLAQRGAGTERVNGLLLASRFAEYTGWISQESGDDRAALWWTDQAVEMAEAAGDRELGAYANVRRALVALYRHDPIATVALARQAGSAHCGPRIRGLAAQREAQGHAIAGDYDACRRALDRAATLLRDFPSNSPDPVIGTSTVDDPVAMVTGWCLFDLGRPASAAEIIERELSRVPEHALRSRTRYGARLALALAGAGEVEHACAVADPVVAGASHVDSATIRTDLRHLARTLSRWYSNRDVRQLLPRLNAALHVS